MIAPIYSTLVFTELQQLKLDVLIAYVIVH